MGKTQCRSWRPAGQASAVWEEEIGLGYQTSGPKLRDPLPRSEVLTPEGPTGFPDSATSQGASAQTHEPGEDTSRPIHNDPPRHPTGCVVSLPLLSTQRSTRIWFYPFLCLSCQRGLKKRYISVGISLREMTWAIWGYLSGQIRTRWLSHLSQTPWVQDSVHAGFVPLDELQ